MSTVPSLLSSSFSALQNGFATLDRGATELVAGSTDNPQPPPAGDQVDLRSGSIMATEPMLAGVRDLMLARVEVGAGAALLHAYNQNRQDLFDMLKDN